MKGLRYAVCALGFVVLLPASAIAQAPAQNTPSTAASGDAGARLKARKLADQGYELYEKGQFAEALTMFRQARKAHHAPTLMLMIARCSERLDRLLEARIAYLAILQERHGPDTPVAFKEAQRDAQSELSALERRIPSLQVTVVGASVETSRVTIDGVPAPLGGQPLRRNPGPVGVVAHLPGRPPVEHTIQLAAGRAERLTLYLDGSGGVQPYGATSGGAGRGSWLPAAIAFGAAGVGLTTGIVMSVFAKQQIDDVRSRCDADGRCLVSDEPRARQAERLAGGATVAFVAGGLAAAAGVVLVVFPPFGGASRAQTQAGVGVAIGPGSVQLGGRF
ncbi:tetratricopeptide repeat protein [Chondromyces crocatus]|uniref:PEGA domain-containing protein n=1 Tax=Chondromyces crocatus TaxID=52 RepID=A0A0K1EKV2_CHOCO|nr:tetratricopeptide repeat protein [Chondromyces crocatus]AKT41282.1 uncharacterized protein CMC5_054490 [Chondromyces crocatus]